MRPKISTSKLVLSGLIPVVPALQLSQSLSLIHVIMNLNKKEIPHSTEY